MWQWVNTALFIAVIFNREVTQSVSTIIWDSPGLRESTIYPLCHNAKRFTASEDANFLSIAQDCFFVWVYMGRHGLYNFAKAPAHSLFKRRTHLEGYHKPGFSKQTCYLLEIRLSGVAGLGWIRNLRCFFKELEICQLEESGKFLCLLVWCWLCVVVAHLPS